MKKTCLPYIAVLVGSAIILVAIFTLAWPERPDALPPRPPVLERIPGAALAAAIAALLLTLGVGAGESAVVTLKDRTLVSRSLAGAQPEDGQRVAACGILVSEAVPLVAPFSGTPCVAYHYEVKHTPSGSKSRYTDCWGYALAPAFVETAAGVIRILGYTEFDFAPTVMRDPDARVRARRYFATTQFVTIGLGQISSAWSNLKELMTDSDGSIRADFGQAPADIDDAKYTLTEQSVSDREPVCALGTYAAASGGLLPVPGSREVVPVRLIKGNGEAVRRTLLWSAVGQVARVVALAGAAAGVGAVFLYIARSS